MDIQKVTIFTHGIRRGPFARLGPTLSRGFQRQGIQSDLVVLNASEEECNNYPDISVVSLNIGKASHSLLPLVSYIRSQKPDVIFSMPWYFNVIAILARFLSGTSTKIIIGEHNICSLESTIEHGKALKTKYLPLLMRYTYPFADGLIGVCNDTITDLIEEIKISPRIPSRVIYNPIDLERIREVAAQPFDHPWLKNHEIPVILTVARMAKQKQLDQLVSAFAKVLETLPARLIILGDGLLRREIEQLCKALDIEKFVSLPGYDQNPYRFMAACDVFVLASAWEGCPIALQEAMACGAAVIVNDAPGGSKDIIGYGQFGMLTPAGNTDALAEAIIRLLTNIDLRKYYQQKAKQGVKMFDYCEISKQYLEFSSVV
jgi:glycosyltransferase involved in cell wall biosynthesis